MATWPRPRTHVVKRLSYILHADSDRNACERDTTGAVKALRPFSAFGEKKQTVSSGKHMVPYDRDSLTAEKRGNASEKS